MDHLNKMREIFQNLRIINNAGKDLTNTVKFIKGWQKTITALFSLWNDFKDLILCVHDLSIKIRQKTSLEI